MTQPEQSFPVVLPTDDINIPTEKVGCIFVTSHLQQFLEEYPPPSDKQAFLDVYHMLSLLDKYLYDNPKQHNHCMSSDNEYVALLKYAIHLNVDLSTFPTLWAVLFILLDIQDSYLEYVKFLQEEYNRYYAAKSRKYIVNLEIKSIEIHNHMHDSVTHDFDRVSDIKDKGSTLLQGQQDEQPEGVNSAENAIDNDVVDILTLLTQMTQVITIKLLVTEIEKKYNMTHQSKLKIIIPIQITLMLIIDRALITKSLSDRLGLGQNSLPGAQQVRVTTMHTVQMNKYSRTP